MQPALNRWVKNIPDEQWQIYEIIIQEARQRGVPFAVGGAFSVAAFTGHWRNTKDLDLYVLPEHKDEMVQVVTDSGMQDYYEKLPYDRNWIYRGYTGDTIIDVIWAMANYREDVTLSWLERGPEVEVRGHSLRVLPAEELIWAKMYIIEKDRCDWTDIFNILHGVGDQIDWEYLVERVEKDWPLLSGLLAVFGWLAPQRAKALPTWLWERLQAPQPQEDVPAKIMEMRVNLLDSRPWFSPLLSEGEN